MTACRSCGLKALSWRTSGHGAKKGSRPQAQAIPLTVMNAAGFFWASSAGAVDEVLGVLGGPRMVGRDVVRYEVEQQVHAAL